MEVIPCILTEQHVMVISDEMLKDLATCSTQGIKQAVMQYLESDEANPVIKERVRTAYAERVSASAFLSSNITKTYCELLAYLDYGAIHVGLDEQILRAYKEAIEYILNSPYAMAYITPITKDTINNILEELKAQVKECKATDTRKWSVLTDLLDNLTYAKKYFRDSMHEPYRGTIVKPILRNRGKYEIILHGVNFLLSKKAQGKSPETWRYL